MLEKTRSIKVKNLSYSINGKYLINETNLDISGAGVTVILGANGAGKTIFLKLLAGLLTPDSGEIITRGKDFSFRQSAMVAQEPVILRRSVMSNILFVIKKIKPHHKEVADELIENLGLLGKNNQSAITLSAGEKQRLSLARALITEPKILLLDEPTANIEPVSTIYIEKVLLKKSRSGAKIFFVTHDINQAKRLAKDIIYIENGNIAEYAKNSIFFKQPKTTSARRYISGIIGNV
jgi:tungstate transport system ATP-binding protein